MSASSKKTILRNQGLLNAHPDRVQAPGFLDHDFFDSLDLLQVKYEMLRSVRQGDLSVTQADWLHGFSRPAYYQIHHAFEQHGIAGLLPLKRGPQSAHKLNALVMEFVDQLRDEDPHATVPEILEKIQERFSLRIHRRSLERALKRQKKKPHE
jgi:transposase